MMFISIQHNTAQSVFSVFRKLDISFVFSGEIFPFCSLCAFFSTVNHIRMLEIHF